MNIRCWWCGTVFLKLLGVYCPKCGIGGYTQDTRGSDG